MDNQMDNIKRIFESRKLSDKLSWKTNLEWKLEMFRARLTNCSIVVLPRNHFLSFSLVATMWKGSHVRADCYLAMCCRSRLGEKAEAVGPAVQKPTLGFFFSRQRWSGWESWQKESLSLCCFTSKMSLLKTWHQSDNLKHSGHVTAHTH